MAIHPEALGSYDTSLTSYSSGRALANERLRRKSINRSTLNKNSEKYAETSVSDAFLYSQDFYRSQYRVGRKKQTVAYHESGHALVAELAPGADPVSKISIIPALNDESSMDFVAALMIFWRRGRDLPRMRDLAVYRS
jgi:hypothetical protein